MRLTSSGRQMQQRALQAVDRYRAALYEGFTAQEIDDFARALGRRTANLEASLGASGPAPRAPKG